MIPPEQNDPFMLDIKVLPQTTVRVKRNRKSATFTIYNNSMESVGYKIKTTKPRDYVVRPNMGMIIPMQHVQIEITLSENTVPDNSHKFLVEIYHFDWRKSVSEFKHYLKVLSPRPAWTSRIGILYEEEKSKEEAVDVPAEGRTVILLAHLYIILNAMYLFYKFFE